jgi:hypothetical protein
MPNMKAEGSGGRPSGMVMIDRDCRIVMANDEIASRLDCARARASQEIA